MAHYGLGYAYLVSGASQLALEQLQHLRRLSSRDAISTGTLANAAAALYDLQRYEEAVEYGRRATEQPKPRIPSHRVKLHRAVGVPE